MLIKQIKIGKNVLKKTLLPLVIYGVFLSYFAYDVCDFYFGISQKKDLLVVNTSSVLILSILLVLLSIALFVLAAVLLITKIRPHKLDTVLCLTLMPIILSLAFLFIAPWFAKAYFINTATDRGYTVCEIIKSSGYKSFNERITFSLNKCPNKKKL